MLEKIIKKEKLTKILVMIKDKKINLEIRDLNIYNVLASLAILSELNLDIYKVIKIFKYFELTEGRGKEYTITRYKKIFKLIDESYNASLRSR